MGVNQGMNLLPNLDKDGVHITPVKMLQFLRKLTWRLREKEFLIPENKELDKEVLFPGRCWLCGESRHSKHTPCLKKVEGCHRCGWERHHDERVCLSIFKPCWLCGRRGHGKDKCPRNRRY